jgi:hypothetical protein
LSGTDGPDWDTTRAVPGEVLLEEVKAGAVKAADRRALWRRMRKVFGAASAGVALTTWLTVNKDNPPDGLEHWADMSSHSQTAIPRLRKSVRSGVHLAEEALYWLTTPVEDMVTAGVFNKASASDADSETDEDSDPGAESDANPAQPRVPDLGTPLALATARQLLARFEVRADQGEAELRASVEARLAHLQDGVALEQTMMLVRGFLAERGEDPEPGRHQFTARELVEHMDVLRHLSTIDPDAVQLWRALAVDATDALPLQEVGLKYHDWRLVQPHVPPVTDDATRTRVAITGRGGMGKSVVLRRLWEDARRGKGFALWLPAERLRGCTPRVIAEAIALGVFWARTRGGALTVFLDAVEELGPDESTRRERLVALARAASSGRLRVVAAARALSWRELRGAQESVPGWSEVELQDWPLDTVQAALQGNARADVGPDLERLLRTPLLLDVFLRTFPGEEEIPVGLQSRHGILTAYWERRVLPRDDPRAVPRAAALAVASEEEVGGKRRHAIDTAASQELVSEGIFTIERGLLVFRHALLRDFAVMNWLSDSSSGAEVISRAGAISAPLVQYGVLRAMLEAVISPTVGNSVATNFSATLYDLLAAGSRPPLNSAIADVLGELDDPRPVDLTRLNEALLADEDPSRFVVRLVHVAATAINHGWVMCWARLPDDPAFVHEARWMSGAVLRELAALLEVSWRELERLGTRMPPPEYRELARRLRIWASARELEPWCRENDGFGVQVLTGTMAEFDPCDATIRWLLGLPRTWRADHAALNALPKLIRNAVARANQALTPSEVVRLYMHAGRLEWQEGALRAAEPLHPHANGWYSLVQVALLGERSDDGGALRAFPAMFLSVAFGLFLGVHRAEKARLEAERGPRAAKLDAAMAEAFGAFVAPAPSEAEACEARLRQAAGPQLSSVEAVGLLEDDTPLGDHLGLRQDLAGLIRAIRDWVITDLNAGGSTVRDSYVPAASGGRSALAWLILLEALVSQDPEDRLGDLTDAILVDHRLYHLGRGAMHWWLGRAITRRWPALKDDQRQAIQANIAEMARSPTLVSGIYDVGPMLACIPEADRKPELRPFEELFELRSWSMEHTDPRRSNARVTVGRIEADERFELAFAAEGLIGEARDGWKRFYRLVEKALPEGEPVDGSRPPVDFAAVDECILLFRELVRDHLPRGEELSKHAWTFHFVARFVQGLDRVRPEGTTQVELSDEDINGLTVWIAETMAGVKSEDVVRGSGPVLAYSDATALDAWVEALHLGDCLLETAAGGRHAALVETLRHELERVFESASPHALAAIAKRFSSSHLLRLGDNLITQLLEAMRRLRDGGALFWALELLADLPREHFAGLARFWLLELPAEELQGSERFSSQLGEVLGLHVTV